MNTEDVTLFHRIVESGSLVEAADLLNLPKSTVSRRLKHLEDDLGIKLFHRQSRAMTLTSAGSHFYQRTLKILADLNSTINEITDSDTEISGHLRIQLFPVPDILPVINATFRFMELHPKLSVELITSLDAMDMVRHNLDVAFKIQETIDDIDMVSRPVLSTQLRFYASPDYLARAGTPTTPQELEQFNTIVFRLPTGKIFNELPAGDGEAPIKVKGNLCTNGILIAREAALRGMGIAYLPNYMGDELVKKGELTPLFDDITPYIGNCFLVYPSRRFVSLACRRYIDFIMEELTEDGKPKSSTMSSLETWI